MMRFKSLTTVALVVLIGLGATLLAQQPGGQRGQKGGQPGGGRGFPGGGMFSGAFVNRMMLLNVAEVRKELELADEQVAAIEKLDAELREKYPFGGGRGGTGGRGNRGKGGNGEGAVIAPSDWYFVQQQGQGQGRGGRGFGQETPEERAAREQRRVERNREERAKLAEILLPHQLKRLNEIYVQRAGTAALGDDEIAGQLGISDAQKAQLAKIREDFGAKRREAFGGGGGGGGGDIESRLAKMRELTAAEDEQLMGVLSADQKAKFEAMKGKTFDMPEGAGRGPGGRGPGGQNRGKGGNNEA